MIEITNINDNEVSLIVKEFDINIRVDHLTIGNIIDSINVKRKLSKDEMIDITSKLYDVNFGEEVLKFVLSDKNREKIDKIVKKCTDTINSIDRL